MLGAGNTRPSPSTDLAGSGRYPRLSSAGMSHIAAASEAIVRERLGHRVTWAQEDSDVLLASVKQLHFAAEKLHDYPLVNADEPSFILYLDDAAL